MSKMVLVRNEIKEWRDKKDKEMKEKDPKEKKEKKERKDGKDKDKEDSDDEKKAGYKAKTFTDIQRIKLEKLMANPEKPVHIPERPKEKNVNKAPEFNHNIMGSSAGAGSGEFHLYRQMRRKEQNRMKILTARADRDELNEAYHLKLEENEKLAMERTEKKRKKRQKKKGKKKKGEKKKEEKESSDEDEDEEEEKEEEKEPSAESQNTNTEPEKAPAEPTSPEKKKKDMVLVFYS
ncbi:PRKR-interacting protein 1 homolog [Eurytemora carolleeae]|uniref:PRKR-interacting protein 1 homolog n=1 Tax=Eurytemora carolleeae TaxID=1294199 RepID=UPI000C776011|nr:PRKR-interacting protein 1 homolog [Eurytemora carolleeae]|eukprot:XP_023339704.1 PRKR-interacting protein 1 homolog [Eurytemora affinis]